MATQTKKPVSRAVVGNTKKSKSSKGSLRFSSRALLFGVVGLLAFSVAAGIGWQQWQDHQLKAKADSYSYHYGGYGWYVGACRAGDLTFKYYVGNPTSYTLRMYVAPTGASFTVYPHSNSIARSAIVSSSGAGITPSASGYGSIPTGSLYNQRFCNY